MYMYNSSMHIDQSIEDSNAVQPVSSIATFCSVAPSLLELRSLTPCSIKTSAILQYVYTTSILSRFTGSSKNIYVDPIETQTVWRKGARCVLSDGCCVVRSLELIRGFGKDAAVGRIPEAREQLH
jgi:hypothetical protein